MNAIEGVHSEALATLVQQNLKAFGDFQSLGEQLLTVSRLLERLGSEMCGKEGGEEYHVSDASLASFARDIYRARRCRERVLRKSLFAEPAWDMLLDLFVHAVEGRKVSTSSLCLAGDVPATTGLRCIRALEREGLVERRQDVDDQRVTLIALSPSGFAKMRCVLADCRKEQR